MTQFAKYIDENTVKYPPRKFVSPTKVIFNFDKASAEILAEEGYIPIVETNSREDVQDETHYARPTYHLVEDKQTETKVTPVTLVNETTGEEYEDTVAEDVVIDSWNNIKKYGFHADCPRYN